MTRYAVFFAPAPDHPLWHAGCDWLGRDPLADEARPPTRAGVGEPWRYGFHATLKAPMRLAPGRDEAGLRAALTALARRTPRFAMPSLSVQWLGEFIALRPVPLLMPSHPLRRLADSCVIELDGWRGPPSPDEQRRRLSADMSDEQRDMLQRHGYAHVLGHWRFHMTLSDALPREASVRESMQHAAEQHFAAALSQPMACDALSLFVEPVPGGPFRLVQRFPLA